MPRCRRRIILGLTFPDPELRFDEATGHWEYGEIDWSRIQATCWPATVRATASAWRARRKAQDDGAWVREAALAYAEKRRARRAAAAG